MPKTKPANHAQANRLGYMLKRAQHALRMSMDELLEPVGITVPQYNVLSAVQLHPGISNAALARGAFVTAQSMQGIVANLERIGLLRRKPHPTHGRIQQSELTKKGAAVLVNAHKLLIGVEEAMTSGFKKEEIETLRSLLCRCAENMNAVQRFQVDVRWLAQRFRVM
jgi:DNA-binding MarR family transcriptional regulator